MWHTTYVVCNMTRLSVTWLIHAWLENMRANRSDSYRFVRYALWRDSFVCAVTCWCVTWLTYLWRDAVICNMPHSCVTCLVRFGYTSRSCVTCLIHAWHAMPCPCVTCLIQVWHDSFNCLLEGDRERGREKERERECVCVCVRVCMCQLPPPCLTYEWFMSHVWMGHVSLRGLEGGMRHVSQFHAKTSVCVCAGVYIYIKGWL